MGWCQDCGYCSHGPCVDDCGQPGGYVCMSMRAQAERIRNKKEDA